LPREKKYYWGQQYFLSPLGGSNASARHLPGEKKIFLGPIIFSVPDLRLRVTADPMVALIDMAMLFTGHNNDEAGEMWHRLQLSSCSGPPQSSAPTATWC
jgi:hypothetical protein